MSEGEALIRRYIYEKDDKLVRFMVAKACLEPLAVANRKASLHPLVVSLWIALSCVVIQLFDWWPNPHFGWLGHLRPLPAFAALALPIIFFIDWYQRPQFEEKSTNTLKQVDIVDINNYYAQTPVSGLWIYDFGDQFVGLVAVDASPDALSNHSTRTVQDTDNDGQKSRSRNKGKERAKELGSTAVIRHLYVAEPYRVANAQDDLVAFTIKRVFETNSIVERITVTPSPLLDYLGHALKTAGFEVVERGTKVGILGWPTLTYQLTRKKWETMRSHSSQ